MSSSSLGMYTVKTGTASLSSDGPTMTSMRSASESDKLAFSRAAAGNRNSTRPVVTPSQTTAGRGSCGVTAPIWTRIVNK